MSAQNARRFGEGIDKGAVDLASVRLRKAEPEPIIGEVEYGIPVPSKPGKAHSDASRAVQELKVGQSRLFVGIDAKRLYGYAKVAKKKGFGSEYAVRMVEDGVRVWRIS